MEVWTAGPNCEFAACNKNSLGRKYIHGLAHVVKAVAIVEFLVRRLLYMVFTWLRGFDHVGKAITLAEAVSDQCWH